MRRWRVHGNLGGRENEEKGRCSGGLEEEERKGLGEEGEEGENGDNEEKRSKFNSQWQ